MPTLQDLYVGLSPYNAPAVFGLLAGTELTDGVWYPRGGFQQARRMRNAAQPLTRAGAGVPALHSDPALPLHPTHSRVMQVRDALQRAVEACGAVVQTGAEVAAITTDPAGTRVTGVALADGRRLEADLVICNRDLASAYQLLEGLPPGALGAGGDCSSSSEPSSNDEPGSSSSQASQLSPAAAAYGQQQHERLGRLKYSAGVIAYNWCVGRPLEGLQHHNVFLSEQWREAWRPAGAPGQLVRAPNFYLHCPSRTDPSAAPPGCESVMVLLPVAHEGELAGGQQEYAALVEAGRQRVLQVSRWRQRSFWLTPGQPALPVGDLLLARPCWPLQPQPACPALASLSDGWKRPSPPIPSLLPPHRRWRRRAWAMLAPPSATSA